MPYSIERTLHPESALTAPLAAGQERFVQKADGSIVHQIGNAQGQPVTVSGGGGGITESYLLPVALAGPQEGPGAVVPIVIVGGAVAVAGPAVTSISSAAGPGYTVGSFDVGMTEWTDGSYPESLMITGTVEGDKRGRILVSPRHGSSVRDFYLSGNPPKDIETFLIGLLSENYDGTATTYQIVVSSTSAVPNEPLAAFWTILHILVF